MVRGDLVESTYMTYKTVLHDFNRLCWEKSSAKEMEAYEVEVAVEAITSSRIYGAPQSTKD